MNGIDFYHNTGLMKRRGATDNDGDDVDENKYNNKNLTIFRFTIRTAHTAHINTYT